MQRSVKNDRLNVYPVSAVAYLNLIAENAVLFVIRLPVKL